MVLESYGGWDCIRNVSSCGLELEVVHAYTCVYMQMHICIYAYTYTMMIKSFSSYHLGRLASLPAACPAVAPTAARGLSLVRNCDSPAGALRFCCWKVCH